MFWSLLSINSLSLYFCLSLALLNFRVFPIVVCCRWLSFRREMNLLILFYFTYHFLHFQNDCIFGSVRSFQFHLSSFRMEFVQRDDHIENIWMLKNVMLRMFSVLSVRVWLMSLQVFPLSFISYKTLTPYDAMWCVDCFDYRSFRLFTSSAF